MPIHTSSPPSSSPPPPKRTRLHSPVHDSGQSLRSTDPLELQLGPASHEFWFEDGDVVLGVEVLLFKIHSHRLAACSSVFADMFRTPEAMFVESVDGRPFIRLNDVTKDWLVTLEAIYDPVTFHSKPVIFDSLAGALRISVKYDINFLQDWAILQLRQTWPVHLDRMGPTAIPHAAEAIALARECAVPSILPAAFYALSVQKWRACAEGGRAHLILSPLDMRRLIAGREGLQDILVDIVAEPLPRTPPDINVDAHPNALPSPPMSPVLGGARRFTFHPACRAPLERFWRMHLTPDAEGSWGTWLMRELHRMAMVQQCDASLALMCPCNDGAEGDSGGGFGGDNEGDVCARCWGEHRRLALWRLDCLREAIPGLFML